MKNEAATGPTGQMQTLCLLGMPLHWGFEKDSDEGSPLISVLGSWAGDWALARAPPHSSPEL